MKEDPSLYKLQQEVNNRIKIATDALLHDDQETARKNLQWVDLSNSILDKYKKRPDNRKLSIIIALASIFLIGIGLTVRLPKTNVSVDLISKSVTLKLKNDWTIDNRFSTSQLNINNVKEIHGAGSNINIINEEPFNIDVKGSNIIIDKFPLSANSEITIGLQNDVQSLTIKNDSLLTDIQIGKAAININDGQLDTIVNYEVPEIFNLQSFPSPAIPVTLTFTDTSSWSFNGMSLSEINFLEESPAGSGKFSSSILSGKVKILETDQEFSLEKADWLHLTKLQNRKIQLTKSGSLLRIHLEGQVSEVRSGSELFEKVLNPSIVEYLYFAKAFAFFWSCIVFMWSLIWSIKNSLFSN